MNVSVIIVNFNGMEFLPACLDGLQAQTRAVDEVIVVDNGSTDGSPECVCDFYPYVRLIATGENLGFAAGNNRGIRASSGDCLILLNNDTVPGPSFIESVLEPLERADPVSAVAGVLVFSTNPDRVATAGIEIFDNGLALDARTGEVWRDLPAEFSVFGPSGGAMAVRRSALDDIELFPEPYFLYLEDVDLAWRLRLREHETVARSDAWALHVYSGSSGHESPLKDYYLARNRIWTLIRCWPGSFWRRFWWNVLLYELGALGFGVVRFRPEIVRGRLAGWAGYARLRQTRKQIQQSVTSAPAQLLYWVCPAPAARVHLGLRRTIARLSRANGRND